MGGFSNEGASRFGRIRPDLSFFWLSGEMSRSIPLDRFPLTQPTKIGIVQKLFSEKMSAITRMRQQCIKHASRMRQNGSCFIGGGKEERSKMSQKCVSNASKMRGTPLGEKTFWTIARKGPQENSRNGPGHNQGLFQKEKTIA